MNGTTTQAPTVTGTTSIRNVVLVGPSGSGKSRLFDHVVDAVVPGRSPRGPDRAHDRPAGRHALERVGGGHPPRRPGQPRLRRGRAGRAEGGGCRPLRRLGGRRRRRAEPRAVARVRDRRDAARGRHHPARRPRRRLRGHPGRLPGPLRRRHPAARGAGARLRRGRSPRSPTCCSARCTTTPAAPARCARPGPSTPSSSTPTGPRSSRGSSRSPRTAA